MVKYKSLPVMYGVNANGSVWKRHVNQLKQQYSPRSGIGPIETGILQDVTQEVVEVHRSVDLFIYLGFYIAFNTLQVISQRVVGRAEETSTYSSLGFCTVN